MKIFHSRFSSSLCLASPKIYEYFLQRAQTISFWLIILDVRFLKSGVQTPGSRSWLWGEILGAGNSPLKNQNPRLSLKTKEMYLIKIKGNSYDSNLRAVTLVALKTPELRSFKDWICMHQTSYPLYLE